MRLRTKLVALFAAILSAGVGTTGAILIWRHGRHEHELLAEKQRLLVEQAAFGFDSNMRVVARELLRLSNLSEMSDLRQNRQLLYSAHQNSIFFREVRIIAADGGVTLVQPEHAEGAQVELNYSDRQWFELAQHTTEPLFFAVPEHASVPTGLAVAVPLPLREGQRFTGVIQGLLSIAHNKMLTVELVHTLGGDGEFVIVDARGRSLFPGAREVQDFSPQHGQAIMRTGWASALTAAMARHSGAQRIKQREGDFMYAWAPLQVGGWSLAVRWPWRKLTEDLRTEVLATVAISAIGMLLVALCGVLFAAYLTRPLEQLGAVARELVQHEPDPVDRAWRFPPSRRRDEIGALSNAFHQMERDLRARDQRLREVLDALSRLNASLEERVQKRTRELEEAQERLVDAERFAAMGKTAAAIAHELRNALNGLGMCVDLVLADSPPRVETMRVRAQLHQEIARLRDVTESLLTFSRTPRLEKSETDLNALCRRAIELLADLAGDSGVTVTTRLHEGGQPLTIECDSHKLQGVVINLVKNAIEATSTFPLDLTSKLPSLPPRKRLLCVATMIEGDRVGIAVSDSGPGVSPEAEGRLFEPFFTTKPTGTGLGLATARRIIDAHGGTITVDVGDEGGARFTIWLPRAPDQASAA